MALPTREDTNQEEGLAQGESQPASAEDAASETSTIAAPSEPETPATSQAPSESDYTQVSTPATPAQVKTLSPKPTPTQQHARRDTRTAIAVPNIPGLPRPKATSPPTSAQHGTSPKPEDEISTAAAKEGSSTVGEEAVEEPEAKPALAPAPAPKSWADLVKRNAKPQAPAGVPNGQAMTNGFQLPKSASLADALKQYNVQSDMKLPFLEPRGLVNTGNMCYMNSVSAIDWRQKGMLTLFRFSKYWCSVYHSTTSWTRCGNGPFNP